MEDTRDDARAMRRAVRGAVVAVVLAIVLGWGLVGWAVAGGPWRQADGIPDTDHVALLTVWLEEPGDESSTGGADRFSREAWEAAVADVRAVDPAAIVTLGVAVRLRGEDGGHTMTQALDGPLPEGALVEGRAPGPGEIVVSVSARDERGWTVGTRLPLTGGDAPLPYDSLVVVGVCSDAASGYVAWADAPALIAAHPWAHDAGGLTGDSLLLWDGEVPPGLRPYLLEG